MAKVTKKNAVFQTTDGTEFLTKDAADRHQAILDAMEQREDAERALAKAIAQNTKTADGHQFNLNKTYYRVLTPIGFFLPHIFEVEIRGYGDYAVRVQNEYVEVANSAERWGADDPKREWHRIKDMYASREAAFEVWQRKVEERLTAL